jgi:hypothetical protein
MELPTIHLFSTTQDDLQTTLRTTVALARQPDARVIIMVSRGTGRREQVGARAELRQWPVSVCCDALGTS